MKFIKKFSEITIKDLSLVGGKNASLGQMISQLSSKNIPIPDGFAITSQAYWHYAGPVVNQIKSLISNLDYTNIQQLNETSKKIRSLIDEQPIPEDLQKEIILAYQDLQNPSVAVRSSATAEDLPTASFAGQQETFLNVQGIEELLQSYKKCVSSLFTPRAIIYRIENNFDHFKIALSVGVQKMINSLSSGVAFTLDPESSFKDVIFINSSWGLGESVVSGKVEPDSFYVHKQTLELGFKPILQKKLGTKLTQIICKDNKTQDIETSEKLRNQFSLNNEEILILAKLCLIIEQHYSSVNNKWTPMDIEWAKDQDNKIYIVQARPETVHTKKDRKIFTKYKLKTTKEPLLIGQGVGQKIIAGITRVISSPKQINEIKKGDILVTTMTDPDWVPIMKIVSGIITDQGGRTCHAAIVSRELGIPAIIGTGHATKKIKNGQEITLDCNTGNIYDGNIPFETKQIEINQLAKLPCKLYINCGIPEQSFEQSFLPVEGVGLARIEFIIANNIKVHPMALINFDKVEDIKVKKQIEEITSAYENRKTFFIDTLTQDAGTIAAAFYPRPTIIRFSDFKSNEYRNLIGGKYFEPEEENPMMGLRGASRYYNKIYQEAFELECTAIKKIYNEMGLKNIKVMVPFVRTTNEAEIILELLKKFNIPNDLEIIMMCEIPSNVILIDQFSKHFNGFSIGSNDLTQFTLAVDRDSGIFPKEFNEQNDAVKVMLKLAIEGAKRNKKIIGICGQAPSDYPEITKYLINLGIDSISLNSDSVIDFLINYSK